MFQQGDRVVHPSHGAGVIKELRTAEAVIEGIDEYYVVELFANRLTMMIPVRNATSLGLREANQALVERALETLTEEPCHLPNEFKTRQKELTDKLRTGDTCQIAEVCRDLTWRSKCGQLTSTDARILEQARSFVATELAAVRGCDPQEASEELSALLAQAMVPWPVPDANHRRTQTTEQDR